MQPRTRYGQAMFPEFKDFNPVLPDFRGHAGPVPGRAGLSLALEIIVAFLMFSCVYFIMDIATPFFGVMNVSSAPFTEVHAGMLTLHGAPH
ncbi:MAG: hypothetical protein ACLGSA_12985 [Acidobacteriota bacterium]